jgi:hypothetical protein
MHESYLEFFCSLELKRTFLAQGKLPINFAATEWFETLLMASDLFTIPENLQRFISYVYTGGQDRKIPFQVKIGQHKRRIKEKKYKLSIDLGKLNEGYWFERIDIACKLAYNIKDKFPKIYEHFEKILLDDLLLWRQAFLYHMRLSTRKAEQFPDLSILFKAVGGLSSKKIFQTIFEDDIWQMIWLIWVDDNTMRINFDGRNKVRPDYTPEGDVIVAETKNRRQEVRDQQLANRINDWGKQNLHRRFTQIIDNLSDFELFYDYLIGEDESEKLTIPLANHQLDSLHKVLYNNMPLKLQKKLYKRTEDLTLLERIGRQDLEHYMREFDRKKHGTHTFVEYLFSFTYNPKVQQKLLELLSTEDVDLETQAAIFKSLLEKFYCVRQVLVYLEKNADKMLDNKLITKGKIRDYLSRIPSEFIPPVLKAKYFSQQDRISVQEYIERYKKINSSHNHLILINENKDYIIGKVTFIKNSNTYDGFTAILDQTINLPSAAIDNGVYNLLEIEGIGELTYQEVTTSGKGTLTYYWVSLLELEPDSPCLATEYLTGREITIDKKHTYTIRKSHVTFTKNALDRKNKMLQITINTPKEPLTDKFLFLPEQQITLAVKAGFYLGNKLDIELEEALDEATKSEIMQLNYLHTEKEITTVGVLKWDFEHTKKTNRPFKLTNANTALELQAEDWYVINDNHLHKDDILDNHQIRDLLYTGLMAKLPIIDLIKDFGINHLYHKLFPHKTAYGIVLRIIPDHNSVLYYSKVDDEIHQVYLEKKHLRSLRENDLVVIEDNQTLYPIDDYERTFDYGFIKSFVNGVQFEDDKNRYFFILNDKSKDFFTHSSRIDFYPQKYDIVSFFPCKNTSAVYTNFPLARKVKRQKTATQEEYIQAEANIDWIIKYQNNLKLEPNNMIIRQELVRLYLENEQYEQALITIDGCLDERLPLLFILQKGNAFLGLQHYEEAMREYQLIFRLPYASKRTTEYKSFYLKPSLNLEYLERITLCLTELGKLNECIKYMEEYFRSHDYSEENIHLVNKQISMLIRQRKNAKAQALIYSIPEEFYPKIGQSFFLIAKTYAKKPKNVEQTIIFFEYALNYLPSAKTYIRYALFTYQIGDFVRANALLKQALEMTDNRVRSLAYYHSKLAKIEKITLLESLTIYEKLNEKVKYVGQLAKQGHSISATKVARALHALYRQDKIDINPLSNLRHINYLKSGKVLWSSKVYEPLVEKIFQHKKPKGFPFIIIEYAYTLLFENNTSAAYALVNDTFEYLETFSSNETEQQAVRCELYTLIGKITKKEAFRLLETDLEMSQQKLEEANSFFILAQEHAVSKQQYLDQYINLLTVALTKAEKSKDLNHLRSIYQKAKNQFPNSNRLLKIKHYVSILEQKLKRVAN